MQQQLIYKLQCRINGGTWEVNVYDSKEEALKEYSDSLYRAKQQLYEQKYDPDDVIEIRVISVIKKGDVPYAVLDYWSS